MNYKRLVVMTVTMLMMFVSLALCENLSIYTELDPGEHFHQDFPPTLYQAEVAKTHYDATNLNGDFTLYTEVHVNQTRIVYNSHETATDGWYFSPGQVQISHGYIWVEYVNNYNASGRLYYDFIW